MSKIESFYAKLNCDPTGFSAAEGYKSRDVNRLKNMMEGHYSNPDVVEIILHNVKAYLAQDEAHWFVVLSNIAIKPSLRGQGNGALLMNELIEFAGSDPVFLAADLLEQQKEGFCLQSWYGSYGFEVPPSNGEGNSPIMVLANEMDEELIDNIMSFQDESSRIGMASRR